ncbi:hypothetical protein FIBSPDRAFT_964561 [Athelia psychrophila]|nr:hypothetical protein FIBSPDRAFT_964561 [Fibularhizoctonia sp. CBS 109695]
MGSMLASFNIEKAIGPDGRPIIPSGRYTTTITSHVEPFKCAITPRSERVKEMILSSDNEAI